MIHIKKCNFGEYQYLLLLLINVVCLARLHFICIVEAFPTIGDPASGSEHVTDQRSGSQTADLLGK